MITREAVNQAIDYILRHSGDTVTLEDVAGYCHFSKYYLSRMFKEQTGESIYGFIRRVKLEQSAFRLKTEQERRITEIGADYGYSSSNYSGVFVSNENVESMIQSGMLIFMISFFFSGVNSITSFYFTATGRAFQSAVISSSRGLVVLLACIFLLPAMFGMTGVWLAAPVTEVVTLGLTAYFLWKEGE